MIKLKKIISPHLLVKPRCKVPKLNTCSRIPTRRDQLEEIKMSPLDLSLKIDLEIWQHYPDNITWCKVMERKAYGEKISPPSEWKGSFDGRRYFEGRLPNHYEWKENRVAVILKRVDDDGVPYFKLIKDKHEEEWKTEKRLMDWYYNGRPGQKLIASECDFEDEQFVVVRAKSQDYRRGRFFKNNRPFAIVSDLDSGEIFQASKHRLFAMDPQFLHIPYRAFRCVVTNRGMIMDNKIIQHKWPLFSGTDTLADIEQTLPTGLENQSGVYLTNFKVERNMQDTLCADMTLSWKRLPLLNNIENTLTNQTLCRFKNVENYKCQVINVSKDGGIWLCTDTILRDSVHAYINDSSKKEKLRHSKLKVAAEFGFQSSIDWFHSMLVPGQGFIVVGDHQHTLYRAILQEVSPNHRGYFVHLVDFGITRRLFNVSEFWCVLPNSKLPSYVNKLPPLSKKYHIEGIHSVSHPYRIMKELHGNNITVQVTDTNRTEKVKERYCITAISVPSILLKVVDKNGDVTIDVNKTLEELQRSERRAPLVSSQFYVRRGDREQFNRKSKKINSENQPITRSFGI